MENIFINDQNKLEELIKRFKDDGVSNLQIVSDFDKTLTKVFIDGKKANSIIAVLRDQNYLTPDYSVRANALHDKYGPIENDYNIPLEERQKAMTEWWETHFKLLIECGLSKSDIEKVYQSNIVTLRDNHSEFFKLINDNNIPLTIITAGGLGGDIINMIFNGLGYWKDNISIIANSFIFDDNGKVIEIKKPIIQSLNKFDIIINDPVVFNKIKEKKNVIMLGDNIEDIGMVSHLDYDNIIKIGFLNEKVEENLDMYKKTFDVVIANDGSLEFVNSLLRSMTT